MYVWSERCAIYLSHVLFTTRQPQYVDMPIIYVILSFVCLYVCIYLFNVVLLYSGVLRARGKEQKWPKSKEQIYQRAAAPCSLLFGSWEKKSALCSLLYAMFLVNFEGAEMYCYFKLFQITRIAIYYYSYFIIYVFTYH